MIKNFVFHFSFCAVFAIVQAFFKYQQGTKDYFGGTVPFPATVTAQEADEMLQMVVCRGIEKRVRELDSTFTFERISDGFLKMKNYLPNN